MLGSAYVVAEALFSDVLDMNHRRSLVNHQHVPRRSFVRKLLALSPTLADHEYISFITPAIPNRKYEMRKMCALLTLIARPQLPTDMLDEDLEAFVKECREDLLTHYKDLHGLETLIALYGQLGAIVCESLKLRFEPLKLYARVGLQQHLRLYMVLLQPEAAKLKPPLFLFREYTKPPQPSFLEWEHVLREGLEDGGDFRRLTKQFAEVMYPTTPPPESAILMAQMLTANLGPIVFEFWRKFAWEATSHQLRVLRAGIAPVLHHADLLTLL